MLAAAGGNPFLAAMFSRRGLVDQDAIMRFTDPDRYQPSPAEALPGMNAGVAEIEQAIREGRRIAVWGDFDVDGQTATTVLVDGLRGLGADVIYHIPDRESESHGLNLPYLAELIQERAGLLVTCDTGISARAEIEYARNEGLRVVITDHHDLPDELPEAEAVINPKLLSDHPLDSLPGVGAAYKLIEALYLRAGRGEETDKYLDLVALGIVADVAEVTGDCRYLLQRGLEVLRRGERLAIRMMCEYAGLLPELITEDDIGFQIGPRLNSLGRLGNAHGVVEFLTSTSMEDTRVFALQLEGSNNQRRFLTEQTLQGALRMIEQDRSLRSDPALMLFNEHWHPGVIGIVASKLVERFHKPVVLLTDRGEGITGGSARSVEGCDLHQAVAACAETLLGYGGHTMAAGMSLEMEQLPKFKARFLRAVADQLGEAAREPELEIEMMVSLADVAGGLVEAVRVIAPYGPGNPRPIFGCRGVRLVSSSPLGRDGSHRRLIVEDGSEEGYPVLWWDGGEWDLPQGEFDLAFTISVGQFRSQQQVQLVLEDYSSDEGAAAGLEGLAVIDLRREGDPLAALAAWAAAEANLQVWMEGGQLAGIEGRDRIKLTPCQTLAIWTAPPSFWVLQQVLQAVKPEKVLLFWVEPETGEAAAFLRQLAGMVKYAINRREGELVLETLSAGLAQTLAAVRLGIAWLEAKEVLEVVQEHSDRLVVRQTNGSGVNLPGLAAVERDLRLVLKETAAFRASLRSQGIDNLREELRQMAA